MIFSEDGSPLLDYNLTKRLANELSNYLSLSRFFFDAFEFRFTCVNIYCFSNTAFKCYSEKGNLQFNSNQQEIAKINNILLIICSNVLAALSTPHV